MAKKEKTTKELLNKIVDLNDEIAGLENNIDDQDGEINDYIDEISSLQGQLDDANDTIDRIKDIV